MKVQGDTNCVWLLKDPQSCFQQTCCSSGRTGMKKLHLSSSFLSQSKCFNSQQGSVQSPGNRLHPALCAEELQLCSFVFLCGCREGKKHEALPPAHVHKMSQSSPKSIFSLPSPPCWSVSMGHFQVGERLQLSVVAILGMLFYRLDLLWFGRNESLA